MKTKLLTAAMAALMTIGSLYAQRSFGSGVEPELKAIISAKRIWIVGDETPIKQIAVKVLDKKGAVVAQHPYSSNIVNWSMDIQQLPSGHYSLFIGDKKVREFER